MDEHKKTQEWVALDNIWRSIPQNLREQNRDNFKVISELIKNNYSVNRIRYIKKSSQKDEYEYLNDLSPRAKQLVIDLINSGNKNLYHSIMSVMDNKRGHFASIDELWDYYSNKLGQERPYIYTHEAEIKEIMGLCLIRITERSSTPLKNKTESLSKE